VKYIDQYAEDFVLGRRDKLIEQVRQIIGVDK